jgi:hypothetical protein
MPGLTSHGLRLKKEYCAITCIAPYLGSLYKVWMMPKVGS